MSGRPYALSISEAEIYNFAFPLPANAWRAVPRFSYPPEAPVIFVKYGGFEIQGEGDMQLLAFEWLSHERARTDCNIYIPEVYKIFTKNEVTFLVMQYTAATPFCWLLRPKHPQCQYWQEHKSGCYDLMAEGLQGLSCMPLPKDVTPGRYSRARSDMRHPIFKDGVASAYYATVKELEDHYNRIAELRYKNFRDKPAVMTVNFQNEPLIFCYSDLNDENFLFETDSNDRPRLWLVDFEHASFLPISYLSWVVWEHDRWPTKRPIQERIGHSLPRNNLAVMNGINYLNQICVFSVGFSPEQTENLRRENREHEERQKRELEAAEGVMHYKAADVLPN